MLTAEEVGRHDARRSCWVIISGQAYDVTEYIQEHPGGINTILRYAGKDATSEYAPIHPPGTIEKTLPKEKHMGPVEPAAEGLPPPTAAADAGPPGKRAPLATLQNLDEFQKNAEHVIARKAYVYFESAAESYTSYRTNKQDWSKVSFRPRIMRNVASVSMQTTIMGQASSLPFFIAPAAMARLGHEDGELCLARGAARYNIPYCSSGYSSVDHAELIDAMRAEQKGGVMLFQLYVPILKKNAIKLIANARRLGYKALVITVDTAVVGKREEDDRYKTELDLAAGIEIKRTTEIAGAAPILRGAHSSTLDWSDLSWIRETWGDAGPVVLKGVQTAEDALMAAQAGVDGIYLSNHGGRQLDHAPSSIRTLLEIRKFYPDVLRRVEVYMDGGVTRGTDIIKALSLGARACALGRPFMYALSAYGTDGVCKAIQLLSDEIETSMRLMGITALSQLDEYCVNTTILERELPQQIRRPSVDNWSKL